MKNQSHIPHLKWNILTVFSLIVSSLLLTVISCSTIDNQTQPETPSTVPNQTRTAKRAKLLADKPFSIEFQIEQLQDDEFYLVISLALVDGAYVISPLSSDTFYMHFDLFPENNEQLERVGQWLEIPSSVMEFDTIIEQPVRFIRQSTVFKQQFKVLTTDKVGTGGHVELLVEPSCIPYTVGYFIAGNSEELTIRKAGVGLHSSFRGR